MPSLLRLCKFSHPARGLTVVVLVVAGILAKLRGVVGNTVFIVVILNGGLNGLLGQHRAMNLDRRQPVECLHDRCS